MSIYINRETRVVVQGITGRIGSFHTSRMMAYGTRVVAGVTPGKGGQEVNGVPVYDSFKQAVSAHPADAAITIVPAPFAKEALLEAADAGIGLLVCPVEGMPVKDMMVVKQVLAGTGVRIIGPNSPGILSVGECSVGILPGHIYRPGPVGIVSRSGTFSILVSDAVSQAGLGETTVVGIGGDPITGLRFEDVLAEFERDKATEVIVIIGEIGGTAEERAAEFIKSEVSKPVVGIVAGSTAPEGKTMGHAGAIIEKRAGSAAYKIEMIKNAGIRLASSIEEIPALLLKS